MQNLPQQTPAKNKRFFLDFLLHFLNVHAIFKKKNELFLKIDAERRGYLKTSEHHSVMKELTGSKHCWN